MSKLNLTNGHSNLLGEQMSTQLTCYLPPWYNVSKQADMLQLENTLTSKSVENHPAISIHLQFQCR